MKSTSLLAAAALLLMSGCTREVYLQAVPCAEGNCEPCTAYTDTCPELELQTVTVQYQVYDIPAPKVEYVPCADTPTRRCRTVCRQTRIY